MKDLFTTDWEAELQPDETAVRKEGGKELKVVLLAGLQRLARMAGITRQECVIQTPSEKMVQAIFSTSFALTNDKYATFVGTADCNAINTTGKFLGYPTAVAESRAEARCLRKALGIRMLSSEEVGFQEGVVSIEAAPTGKADTAVIAAIEKLCETRNIDPVRVLEEVIEDATRSSSIFQLSELTVQEAQRALAWLNEQKLSVKTLSAKEERDARKKELIAKGDQE